MDGRAWGGRENAWPAPWEVLHWDVIVPWGLLRWGIVVPWGLLRWDIIVHWGLLRWDLMVRWGPSAMCQLLLGLVQVGGEGLVVDLGLLHREVLHWALFLNSCQLSAGWEGVCPLQVDSWQVTHSVEHRRIDG